jgi:hypothetical protein
LSKLKFNFIEHQTKQLFISSINNQLKDFNKSVKALFEHEIKLIKEEIKLFKDKNLFVKTAIEKFAEEIGYNFEICNFELERFKILYNKAKELVRVLIPLLKLVMYGLFYRKLKFEVRDRMKLKL